MGKKVPTTGVSEAQSKASKAAGKLKRRDAALYWATVAQTAVLTEIRDELRKLNRSTHGVTLPDEAPRRGRATVAVNEH
jgi:hypothetical protein